MFHPFSILYHFLNYIYIYLLLCYYCNIIYIIINSTLLYDIIFTILLAFVFCHYCYHIIVLFWDAPRSSNSGKYRWPLLLGGRAPRIISLSSSVRHLCKGSDCTKLLARHMTFSDDHCELEMLVNQY